MPETAVAPDTGSSQLGADDTAVGKPNEATSEEGGSSPSGDDPSVPELHVKVEEKGEGVVREVLLRSCYGSLSITVTRNL